MQQISTLAPPGNIRDALPAVYGNLLSSSLLAEWQAHPDRVIGRDYGSSPWPSGIQVRGVECATPDTCRVTGQVDYITSNELEHGGVFMRRGITLDAARMQDGWRITAVRLAAATNH